jgi:hypothetical protein
MPMAPARWTNALSMVIISSHSLGLVVSLNQDQLKQPQQVLSDSLTLGPLVNEINR